MIPNDVIVLTPPGLCDPSLAIAAARAGARGFLDIECAKDDDTAWAAVARADRFVPEKFGIKIGRSERSFAKKLLVKPPAKLAWVLLSGYDGRDLKASINAFVESGIEVLFEAVSLEEARRAETLQIVGLVLKGNEAGGRVSGETAFILAQRWWADRQRDNARPLSFWVQGGIGLNTAAACLTLGAAGVVLDSQLLLTRETPLSDQERNWLSAFDGSETVCLGERVGMGYRLHARAGTAALQELNEAEDRLCRSSLSADAKRKEWRAIIGKWHAEGALRPLGQDACFAKPLADRFVTVAGIIQAICNRSRQQVDAARRLQPLAENSALAVRHGTRYPIVQGPMTRVSDTAAFADAVSRAGALPFLALALSRKPEVEKLLEETRSLTAGRSWGVGILGFVPAEIRQEQIEALRACPPPFALIAGGRPDQVRQLEKEGIFAYLHVPSPGLLRMFLREGSRHFVFEGRECGGHVGPRTSFVLWETMCEVLLEHINRSGDGEQLHVIFAGGVHDAVSAAMVSALSATLAERGVAVGVLMGTAYLFTHEAVSSGAIVRRFQKEALDCDETVLLRTSQGHAIRCAKTPYCGVFESEKRRLLQEGKSHEEIVKTLEWKNIGRLRIASKGIDRVSTNGSGASVGVNTSDGDPSDPASAASKSIGMIALSDADQYERGMYMIGQIAAMRSRVVSIAELHEEISAGSRRFQEANLPIEVVPPVLKQPPCDIAIVGIACNFPKAPDLTAYWENILSRQNAIIEIPPSYWDWRLYYDADPKTPDKIISKWGGFLDDIPFDPLTYGIAPASLPSIDPLQLYLLESVRHALADAGYSERPFDRERTCAILGIGGGGSPLPVAYGFRTCLPLLDTVDGLGVSADTVLKRVEKMLPSWTEDSFPGILSSVAAGRVANRFDLGGANYTIDAACGSSLAALQACVRELESGTSDMALAMAADMVQTPYAYMAFSKTHALSPRGQCRPFDAGADGIALSEGMATLVLKRRADAERDGDRIYAIIRGMGASSDGRAKGLTAPRAEGQLRALRRAYERAGISPAQMGLIEAHGTGTVAGDQTEAEALGQVLREAGAEPQSCAIGSVKSMIGHSKCAAGLAGLIKSALALQQKVLPPTLVEKPSPKCGFENGPLYLNGEVRPWIHGSDEPRRAGVSAFGFGGTNFHIVLEEYTNQFKDGVTSALRRWPAELLVWRRDSVQGLMAVVEQCRLGLTQGATPELADLAHSLWEANPPEPLQPTLAVVATSLKDLEEKLDVALEAMRASKESLADPRGVYFRRNPGEAGGKVAFLFPGQGSQYPNMLSQLAIAFNEVREAFDYAERNLSGELERPLGCYIFPPTAFSPEHEQQNRSALMRTEVAQPAVGAADMGMFRLLTRLGLKPDFLAGHSYGDYVALCAAGALAEDDLPRLSHLRGKIIVEASSQTPGGMAAFDTAPEALEPLIAATGVTIANKNAPRQTVISGTETALEAALAKAKELGIHGQRIAVSRGFHSPLVTAAREPFARVLAACSFTPPRYPVFSNTTATTYPNEPAAIQALLTDHLVSPVHFHEEIVAMYEAGARVFVEVGPQAVLTGLIGQILADQPHAAVASDIKGRPGLVQLAHLLGQLLTCGLPIDLRRLHADRNLRLLDLTNLVEQTRKAKLSPSTWIINSVRSRPLDAPEPILLGQPRPAVTQSLSSSVSHPASPSPTSIRAMDKTLAAASKLSSSARSKGGRTEVATASEETQVMLRYQELMSKFLETQKSVMTSFLQGVQPVASPTQIDALKREPIETSSSTPVIVAQEPSAPLAPTAQPHEPKTKQMDRAWFTGQLLDLVSKRTGYPKDMLRLDQNLEADLGIDSIKRVEILDSMAAAMDDEAGGIAANLEMEKLVGLKSLGAIIDYLENALAPPTADTKPAQAPESNGTKPPVTPAPKGGNGHQVKSYTVQEYQHLGVQRALVRLVDAPPLSRPRLLLPRGVVLFTDDGRGIAREMADQLADFGEKTVLVNHSSDPPNNGKHAVFHADLTDSDAVDRLLQLIRQQHGAVAGLVHLLPLAEPPSGEEPLARMQREVKSLYLLARGLDTDLRQAGRDGGAILLSATDMGGAMGYGESALPPHYFAGHGGVAGFVKCLAFEWPAVLVRAVDFDTRESKAVLVERLLAECSTPEGPTEIGYFGTRRVTWEPMSEPLQKRSTPLPLLNSDSTILITGGARGITGAIAVELARRYRPNLIITGRSPRPVDTESCNTASLTTPADIKACLIASLQREGAHVPLSAVEAQFHRLTMDREMRSNLKQIAEAGSKVEYHQVDARDRAAMTQLFEAVEKRFGGFDGVIHGAGIMEDKLLKDKTPESFDRVFGTKAASAVLLAEFVKPERLKFFVFFASITSRYGNKGQADYAAGNEVLSKMALKLDRTWPCRVLAACWGPWSRIGMTADLEQHLTQRGLKLISPEEGPGMLIDELMFGKKGETEVIIAGGSDKAAAKPFQPPPKIDVLGTTNLEPMIENPHVI
jgi:acyl transferase domain-containing protein/NAD(P)H-dependent flavin oxidoreductase YrpB (nitropropane dioxygenase family)/NAD(P)-dependent dehydrogenase (short-subunit alcohol dehydrogenase family)